MFRYIGKKINQRRARRHPQHQAIEFANDITTNESAEESTYNSLKISDAFREQGDNLYDSGKYTNESAEESIYNSLKTSDDFRCQGDNLCDSGKYDEALRYYDRAIDLNASNHVSYNNRCLCLIELGRFKDALDNINQAINLKESSPYLYYTHRGVCLYELGQRSDALKDFNQSIQLNPSPEGYTWRGGCHYWFGKFNKALEDFEHAIALGESGSVEIDYKKTLSALNCLSSASEVDDPATRASIAEKLEIKNLTSIVLKKAEKIYILKKKHGLDFNEALAYLDGAANSWLLLKSSLIEQKNFPADIHLYITSLLLDCLPESTIKIANTFNKQIYTETMNTHLSNYTSGLFSGKKLIKQNNEVTENYVKRNLTVAR